MSDARDGREAVWACTACGKRSRDRYGRDPIDRGWDVSCFLHAVRVHADSVVLGPDGRVIAAVRVDRGGGAATPGGGEGNQP